MGIYIVHHIYIQNINSMEPLHGCMIKHIVIYPIVLFVTVLLFKYHNGCSFEKSTI